MRFLGQLKFKIFLYVRRGVQYLDPSKYLSYMNEILVKTINYFIILFILNTSKKY